MKISLNWLKKFTNIELDVDALVAKIGSQLGSVDEVIDARHKYDGIKVVRIIEARPHDNADKLNIYQITDGQDQVQVVSGDRNLNVGDKVAWLAPGTTVPTTFGTAEPFILGSRQMRGVISHGMFGSGKELDINDDDQNVLKLDDSAVTGQLLADAYELDDVIIDIENKMFTHRPDCFGLLGVAREVAGIQGQEFVSPDWYQLASGLLLRPQATADLKIINQVPELCPEYQAAVLTNIVIEPSAIGRQSYLKRVGIRPINNVVDITNYLMYLTGQPLHAFDYDKVAALSYKSGPVLVVRKPQAGEKITLLDGREIEPHLDAILVATDKQPLAIGGVMGGNLAEVDAQTTSIIIESANFNMYSIRRTSMKHGIFTDAVTRYSKGQSLAQCGVILAEAIELLTKSGVVKLATEIGLNQPVPGLPITTSTDFINKRLGSKFSNGRIVNILHNVEIDVVVDGDDLTIAPPYWRTDLDLPEDIVEEIGRLNGFDKLPHVLPNRPAAAVEIAKVELLKARVRRLMTSCGNNELQTYSFVAGKLLDRAGQDRAPAYKIRNAISPELQMVRTSLLPSLIDKVHVNHKTGFAEFGLFEIGKSHSRQEIGADELPKERLGLSFVFSVDKKAAQNYSGAAFYQSKKQLSYLLGQLHYDDVDYRLLAAESELPWWLQNLGQIFEPQRSALVLVAGVAVGIVGEFSKPVYKNFKLPDFAAGFEIDLGLINGLTSPNVNYQPLSRFPATDQDLCFKVKQAVLYTDLESLIKRHFVADERLQLTISPVDIYQRPEQPDYKQMTYRINLRHHDRTLTTDEVSLAVAKIAQEAQSRFGAELI